MFVECNNLLLFIVFIYSALCIYPLCEVFKWDLNLVRNAVRPKSGHGICNSQMKKKHMKTKSRDRTPEKCSPAGFWLLLQT